MPRQIAVPPDVLRGEGIGCWITDATVSGRDRGSGQTRKITLMYSAQCTRYKILIDDFALDCAFSTDLPKRLVVFAWPI